MIVFVILAAGVLAGWYFLAAPTGDPSAKKVAQADKKEKPKDEKEPEIKDKEKEKPKEKVKEPEKKPEVKPAPKSEPAKTETLGGDGFHLTVDITSRGAGVRRVALNRFKAADWRGKPTEHTLELIQDDEFASSYRMYHYEEPGDDNPVLGLGEKTWAFEGKKTEEGYHEASYSTTVPGLDHIKILKTYRLGKKDYHVGLLVEVHDTRQRGGKNEPTPFRYQLTGAKGLAVEGEWYASIFRNAISLLVDEDGLHRNLEDSLRISARKGGDTWPEAKYKRGNSRLQYAGVANQYFAAMIVVDDKQPKKDEGGTTPDKILAWARPTLETEEKRGVIVKIFPNKDTILFRDDKNEVREYHLLPRTQNHFKDLELQENQSAVLSFYKTPDPDSKLIAAWVRIGTSLKPQFDDITVRVNSEKIELAPGAKAAHQFILYHGPIKAALLAQFTGEKEVDPDMVVRYHDTLNLYTLTDYRSDNVVGKIFSTIGLTKLIIWFTTLMHWLLNKLHMVFGSYGLSIIVLTVIVRGVMFPISRKQAMFSIKMQELAPEMKKIKERYKDDQRAQMQALSEFNRKHGINPLGSCWPIFLQMPIFLGLYFALQESIHFRLASFFWIDSLSAPDMSVYWTESIPIISVPDHASGLLSALYLGPYLNVLPLIAVVFMMIQQAQTMPPAADEQQEMQQKMMKYMSILFGIMFYKVAAGLCIYFIASSMWGLAERKLLPKKKTQPDSSTSTEGTAAATANGAVATKWKGKSKKEKEKELKEKEKAPVTAMEKLKALWRDILKAAEKK